MTKISVRAVAFLLVVFTIITSVPISVFAEELRNHPCDAQAQNDEPSGAIPGDVDENGRINARDAILVFRYVAGWQIDSDPDAMDVNMDGEVNAKDTILLFRYVAGWDVELGGEQEPEETESEPEETESEPEETEPEPEESESEPEETEPEPEETESEPEETESEPEESESEPEETESEPEETESEPEETESEPEDTESEPDEPSHVHIPVVDAAVEPTCNQTGLTEGSHCDSCGVILLEQETVNSLGHEASEDEPVVVLPTCREDGYTLWSCARCGGRFICDYVCATPHVYGEPQALQSMTCTQDGIFRQYCVYEGCDRYQEIVELSPGHNYYPIQSATDGAILYRCLICEHEKYAKDIEAAEADESFASDCPVDFVFTVRTEMDEGYIRENLKITDLFFKNAENDLRHYADIAYQLRDLGDGCWEVSSVASYKEARRYEVTLSGDLQFAEYRGSKLTFTIYAEEKNVRAYHEDMIFLRLPTSDSPLYGKITLSYEEGDRMYLRLPIRGRFDDSFVGRLICVGDYASAEELMAFPGRDCEFARIEAIHDAEDGSCQLVLAMPDPAEVYAALDIHTTEHIDITEEDLPEGYDQYVRRTLYESEEFTAFVTRYVMATELFAAENDLIAADSNDLFDSLDTKVQFSCEPDEEDPEKQNLVIAVTGSLSRKLMNDRGTEFGSLMASFSVKMVVDFRVIVDYEFVETDGGNKSMTYLFAGLEKDTDITLTFSLSFKGEKSLGNENLKKIVITPEGRAHLSDCYLAKAYKTNLTTVTVQVADSLFRADPKGCLLLECVHCRPYTSYLQKRAYVVAPDHHIVHSFASQCAGRLDPSASVQTELPEKKNGYTYCELCLPEDVLTQAFRDCFLADLTDSADWSATMDKVEVELKSLTDTDESQKSLTVLKKTFLIAEVVTIDLELDITLTLKLEASLQTNVTVHMRECFGVIMDGAENWRPHQERTMDPPGLGVQLIGQIEAKAALSGSLTVSVLGMKRLLHAKLALSGGIYLDIRGCVVDQSQDIIASGGDAFAAGYIEIGGYWDLSLTAQLAFVQVKVTLAEKKSPILMVGYHRYYYGYGMNMEELTVNGYAFNFGDYDTLEVLYFHVKELKTYKDQLVEGGVTNVYSMDIAVLDAEGNPHPYAYLDEETWELRLTDDAPCATDVYLVYTVEGHEQCVLNSEELLQEIYSEGNFAFGLKPFTRILHVNNHAYGESVVIEEPTCCEKGILARHTVCGCVDENGDPLVVYSNIPETGQHSWSDWTVILPETCITEGVMTRVATCACKDAEGLPKTETVRIPAQHIPVTDEAVPATCTTVGWTEGVHCDRIGCEIKILPQVAIPALGHAYADEFTCHDRACTRTELNCTHVLAATTEHIPTEPLVFENPDYPELSFTARCCTVCGDILEKNGGVGYHNWDYANMELQLPTCTETGRVTLSCLNEGCGVTVSTVIPMIAHVFCVKDTEAEGALKSAATCTQPAVYYLSCMTCGGLASDKDNAEFYVGQVRGHSWSEAWSIDPETETHYHGCENGCGERQGEEHHTYNYRIKEAMYLKSKATCVMPDIYYYSCICGHFHEKVFESGEPQGHTPVEEIYVWSYDEDTHYKTCPKCDQALEDTVTRHTYDRELALDDYLYAKRDCGHGDRYYRSCMCGKAAGDEEHLFALDNALGHIPDEHLSTDELKGTHFYACRREGCGIRLEEAAHTFDQLSATETYLKSEATCTVAAIYYLHCVCGMFHKLSDYEVEVGAPLDHMWKTDAWTVDPDANTHYYACGREECGARLGEAEHSGGEATCISSAFCEICGYMYAQALGHMIRDGEWLYDPDAETHYHGCARCTDRFDEARHEYDQCVTEEEYLIAEATCTEPSRYLYSCVCGLGDPRGSFFAVGAALNHDWRMEAREEAHVQICLRCQDVVAESHTASQATCTDDAICVTCGWVVEKAFGHSPSEWLPYDSETHHRICTIPDCGHTLAESGHTWGEATVEQVPTCYQMGSRSFACEECGYIRRESLPTVPHIWDMAHHYVKTVVDAEKTTEEASRYIHIVYQKCVEAACSAQREILRTGSVMYHTFTCDLVNPTCTADGYVRILPPDGIKDAEPYEQILPALGHDYGEAGVCNRCGATEIRYSQGLEFTSNGDGTCYVSGIGTCTDTDLLIPPVSPEGDAVIGIGSNAFAHCYEIETVAIPDSVTYLEEFSFYWCTALTGITIPAGVTVIEDLVFGGCEALVSLQVAEGNRVFHSDGNCIIHTGSKTLIVGCKTSTIPDDGSVLIIGNTAFDFCWGLTDFVIPEGVIVIGRGAFQYCRNLTSIVIPASVQVIEGGAFYECNSLQSMTIPDGVTVIDGHTFYGCSSLKSLVVPGSVTGIGQSATYGCTALTDIYYDGFESDWQAITIGTNNEPLLNATIHFKKVTPDIPVGFGEMSFVSNGDGTCCLEHIGGYREPMLFVPDASPDGDTVTRIEALGMDYRKYSNTGNPSADLHFALLWCLVNGDRHGVDYMMTGVPTLNAAVSITIPRTVKVISDIQIFRGLDHIYYLGTEAEWNAIVFETAYTTLPNTEIHFLGDEARHIHEYTTITAPYTCEKDGYHVTVCFCGDRKDFTPIATTGHDFIEQVTQQPTCTQEGERKLDCANCWLVEGKPIPALGHDCGEDGHCTRCGELVYSEGSELTPTATVPATSAVSEPVRIRIK